MPEQPDLLPVSLSEQIAEIERELALREHVYPRWIANHQLSEQRAARQMRALTAVLDTLYRLTSRNPNQEAAP